MADNTGFESGHVSYWVASTEGMAYPSLEGDVSADVVVVGAGMVGLTAAVLLQDAGLDVVVVEMQRVGYGVTGYTTGKLTASQSTVYSELESKHGPEVAKAYAAASERGLAIVADLAADGIECDFERCDNYVYAESPDAADEISQEVAAAQRAGLAVEETSEVPLPYEVARAARLPGQAQFHARKYLLGLAERFTSRGGRLFEGTRATGLSEAGGITLETDRGTVSAAHAVVANHYPFLDRALLFPRVRPQRSYVVAGPIEESKMPEGMHISSDSPTRSIRTIPDGDRRIVMVSGEGHTAGEGPNPEDPYAVLAEWSERRLGMKVEYRWSAQDGVSVDTLPYIGPYRPGSSNVYVATAFRKWGLTTGAVAAEIITDAITGNENRFASLFDPKRINLTSVKEMGKENLDVAKHFVGDRISHPQEASIEDLAPGEAGVSEHPFKPVAAYRDESGKLHKVSAVCTHLGCIVAWNGAEKSWDCPCHGSRFTHEGKVIEGPATRDLSPADSP